MWRRVCVLIPLLWAPLGAQQQTATSQDELLQTILRRLERLEQQNRELMEQIKQLKQTEGHDATAEAPAPPAPPPIEERVKVVEARVAEQAQTKVEASQKFPVSLYGTFLFNAFSNSKDPTSALGGYGLLAGPGRSGATLRQTILGLEFHGPSLPGGGHVEGDFAMDFWAGPPNPSDNWMRIRRAGLSLVWPNRTVFVGQDKPLISPYEPDSLAEVGVSPLAGAGNLWFWLPQVRVEQRLKIGADSGVHAQLAVLQVGAFLPQSAGNLGSGVYAGGARPALEGRVAFWHGTGERQRFEIAPGFQISSSRVAGANIATQIGSLDWSWTLLPKLEWKGTGYFGANVASLGSLGNGFYLDSPGTAHAVRSVGGWTQLSSPLNNRLTLNVMSGLENDQTGNVYGPGLSHSFSFAGNAMVHLSPNVLFSVEAQRLWTRTFLGQQRAYNHYDLALAYLF